MHASRGYYPGYAVPSVVSIYLPNHVGIKALESAHAVWEAVRLAKTLPQDQDIVLVCYCDFFYLHRSFTLHLPSVCLDAVTRTWNRYPSFSLENGQTF